MSCRIWKEHISEEGLDIAFQSSDLKQHISTCDECRARVDEELHLSRILRGEMTDVEIPRAAIDGVMARLDEPTPSSRVIEWHHLLRLAAVFLLVVGLAFVLSMGTEKMSSPEDDMVNEMPGFSIQSEVPELIAQLQKEMDLEQELARTGSDINQAMAFIAARL